MAHQWQVQIHGRASDLEHLARHFTGLPRRVTKDERDGRFLYASDSFAACATSEEVLAVADQELAILSGVVKLARKSHEPLRSGVIYRQNPAGGPDVFVPVETAQLRIEPGEVTVTATDSKDNLIARPTPPPRTVRLAQLAASDVAVRKSMRLHAEENAKSWIGLYRIYEVIEADAGGKAALAKSGWSSPIDHKRFKHSANSVTVAGDAARHGKETQKPPKQPMSLHEAEAYVHCLMEAWLASKGGG